MDAAPHPPPRLRVSRNPPPLSRDLPPMPGPSSADQATFLDRASTHHDDGDWPASRTPAPYHPPSANGRSPDAMRLRDLLDQTSGPSSDARPVAPAPRSYPSSELESDYDDIPNFGGGPSLARESLKALFNSALADTPERTRRSNVDGSDMDMSPVPSRPIHQRNWSISDDGSEDAEGPSASLRPTPGRKLSNGSPVDDKPTPRPELKNLLVSDTESDDTATTALRNPNTAKPSPPNATNNPFHSIHMSPNESNLMDQDSEMQRAMQDFDSYIASARNSPMPFPSSRKHAERVHPTTPLNHTGDSDDQQTARRPKMTVQSSLDRLLQRSSPKPNLSGSQSYSGREERDSDRPLSRNKSTARPPPATPALKRRSVNLSDLRSSPPVTNGHSRTLTRKTSSTSLGSDLTSPGSSRRGSVISNSDLSERRQSMRADPETSWGKPRPRSENLSHFNLSQLDERSRALSSPSRPGSSMSLTFEHQVRSRHRLSASSSFGDLSSRSVSPSNSMFSVDEEREEIIQAVEHERERNWGSNRPQWRARKTSETLLSSRPPSPTDSVPGSPHFSPSFLRRRTESLRSSTASPAGLRKSPSSASLRASPSAKAPLRSPSPSLGHRSRRISFLQTNASTPGPPNSPSKTPPTVRGKQKQTPVDISDFSTGSARSTHSRTYSTPARPSSRLSISGSPGRPSQIPVYSPGKKKKAVPVPKPVVPEEENLSVFPPSSSARQLPKIEVSTAVNGLGDSATSSDAEDNATPRVQDESTPTMKTVLPPMEETPRGSPVDDARVSPRLRPATNDEARLQRTIGSPLSVETSIERTTTPPSAPPASLLVERSTTPPSPPLPSSPEPQGSPEIPTSPELPSSPVLSTSPEPRPPSRMRVSPLPRPTSPQEDERIVAPRQSSRPTTPKQPSRPPTPRESSRPPTPRETSRPPTPKDAPRPSTPRDTTSSSTPRDIPRSSTPKHDLRPPTPRDDSRPVSPRPPSRSTTPQIEVSIETESEPFVSLPAATPEHSAFTIPDASLLSSTPNRDYTPSRQAEQSVMNTPANVHPNWSSIATPKPPGAWLATPAPSRRTRANSLPTQTDPDESSRSSISPATPVASLGRSTSVAFQTPAPPGAYIPTPAARKSILRVRFDQAASSARPATGDWSESFEQSSDMSGPEGVTPRPRSASPQRSPGQPRIRVLDAFGRPETAAKGVEVDQAPSPRRSPIRIVDASGREIKEEESAQITVTEDEPQTHNEALKHVRRDVVDLTQQFDDMDVKREAPSEEVQRLRHLEEVSRESRQQRERLTQDLQSRELDFKAKFAQQRENIERSRSAMASSLSRPSAWTPRVWITLLAVQVFVAILIYKYMHMRAEELFLTTYYDTFYGDFYLPDPPDSPRYAIPSRVTWFYQHHQDGWKSFLSNFWRYLCLFIMDVQSYVRDRWLRQEPAISWPPT